MSSADSSLLHKDEEGVRMPWTPERWDFVIALGFRVGEGAHERGSKVAAGTVAFWCMIYLLVGCVMPVLPIVEETLGGGERQSLVLSGAHGAGMLCVVVGMAHYVSTTSAHLLSVLLTISPIVTSASLTFLLKGQAPFHLLAFAAPPVAMATGLPEFSPLALAAVVLLLFAASVYAEQNPASPSVEGRTWDRVAVYTAHVWFGALPFFLGTLLSTYFLRRRAVAPSRHLSRFIHTFLAEQSRGPKVVEAAAAAAAAAAASPQASPPKSDAASVASTTGGGGAAEVAVSLYEAEEGQRGYTCGRVLGGTLRATVSVLLVVVLAAAGGGATFVLARHFHREESSRHALAHKYSASSSDLVTETVMQRLLGLLRELPAEMPEEELLGAAKPSPPLPVIRLQLPFLPFHLMSFSAYERHHKQSPGQYQARYFPSWESNVLASEVVTTVNAAANTSVPLSYLVANATRTTVAFNDSLWEWRSANNKNETNPLQETDVPATAPPPIEFPPGVISTSGPVPASQGGPANEERVASPTPSPWSPTPITTPSSRTFGTGDRLVYGSDLARLVGYEGLSGGSSLYEEAVAGELPFCQAPAWARGGGHSDHSAGEMLQNHAFSLHLVQVPGSEPMLAIGCIWMPDATVAAKAADAEASVQRAAEAQSNVTRAGAAPGPPRPPTPGGATGSVTSVKGNTTRGHVDAVQLLVLAVSASSLLPHKKSGFLVSTNLSLAGTSDVGGPTLRQVVEKDGGSLGLGMAISFETRIPFGSKGSVLLLTTAMDHEDLWRPLMGDLEVSLLALWLTILAAMLAALLIVWAGFRPINELAQTAKVYACGDLPLEELTLHTMRFKELVYLKWSLYRLANAVLGARQLVPPGAIDLLTGNHGEEGEEDSWMDMPVSASPDGCDVVGEYVGGSFCFETPPSHPEQDPPPPVAANGGGAATAAAAITDGTAAGAQAAASTTVGGNGGSGKGRTESPDANGRPHPAYDKPGADDGMVSTPSLSAVSMPALDPVARRGSLADSRRHPLRAPGSPSGATPGSDDLPNSGPSSHWHEMSPRLDKSGTPLQLLQTRRVPEVDGGGGGGSGGGCDDGGQHHASSSSAVHSPEGASSPHTFPSPRPGGSSSDLLQGSVVPGAGRMYGGGGGAGAGAGPADSDASVRSLGRRKVSVFGAGAAATSPQGDVEAVGGGGGGGAAAGGPRKKSVRFDLGLSAHRLQTAEAAVMALNMVGLFPLWRMGKEVVIRQFYTVFSAALTTVSSCQGVTVSVVGDRLLALWRSDRTARACDAALRIQAACAEGSRTDGLLASGAQSPSAVKMRGDHPARVRISLSGGRVIWGNFSLCQEEGRPCAVLNAFGQPINRAAAVERFSRQVDTFTAVDSWVYNRMTLSQPAFWTRPVAIVAYRFAPSVSKRPYPSAIHELLPSLSDAGHGWSLFAELSYEHDTSIADYAPGAEGGKAHARAFAAACAGEWAEAETLLKGAVVPVNIHVSRLLQTVLERKPPVELEA